MKQAVTILIITLWTILPFTNMYAQYGASQRQPFQQQKAPVLRSPADELPNDNTGGGTWNGGTGTGFGGPGEELPNDDEGGGGWVGMPVADASWLLLLLAICYGITTPKSPKGDLEGKRHK